MLIFALGGGVSVLQGIRSLHEETVASNPLVSYCVLVAAAVFEGAALAVSIREFKKTQENSETALWRAIALSKDPGAFIVIVEDSAALVGLAIAFLGVWFSEKNG